MSELRKQIEAARAAHLAQTYPGDLVADVLDGRARVMVLRRIAAALAVAAMVTIAMVLWPGSADTSKVALRSRPTTQKVFVAESTDQTPAAGEARAAFSLTGIEVPDMSTPSGMSMVPSFGSMTVSEVPAITDVVPENQDTTTTKETTL